MSQVQAHFSNLTNSKNFILIGKEETICDRHLSPLQEKPLMLAILVTPSIDLGSMESFAALGVQNQLRTSAVDFPVIRKAKRLVFTAIARPLNQSVAFLCSTRDVKEKSTVNVLNGSVLQSPPSLIGGAGSQSEMDGRSLIQAGVSHIENKGVIQFGDDVVLGGSLRGGGTNVNVDGSHLP